MNNIKIINKEKEMDLDKLNSGMRLSMIKIEKLVELNIEKNKNKSNIIIPIDYKNIHLLATLSLIVDKVEEAHDENKMIKFNN